ncbi:hypothetical protein LUZ62_070117 [Rhynchospora pubera]|uniref:DUF4378 domain-containing protein n=1 Tax=Rhynchospora pubera TaxID=906938 RepID=A0AAV8CV77_9POAL|nr:hypothetical protein LUZ62_070117 [Rhynchospora pubera]
MINVFDLSAGMAGAKLLTEKPHRDDSPVRKIRQDVKKSPVTAPNLTEDKLVFSEIIRNSTKRHKGTPMKALLDKEMSKETEPRRKQTSVVAKLMGLEDPNPSNQHPANPSPARRNSTGNCSNAHRTHGSNQRSPSARHARHSSDEIVNYKDVYEVQCQGVQNGRNLNDGRDFHMDLVRRKFTEAKRLATDDRLLHSREFQDALDVLSSNRELFLKFLEEPNSLFSIPPPQTKRITVLKPVKSFESSMTSSKQIKRHEPVDHKPNRRLDSFSQPTRIVVLKPSPSPRRTDEVGSARNSWHRRDESLISSICSNGYGGDDSSLYDQSDNGYLEEDAAGMGGFSDSEAASPLSHNSWGLATVTKLGSSFSVSSFSRDMYSPESSVIKEAKKRLSERWAMVTSDDVDTVPVPVLRSSSTLGEMLSIQELKKEKEINAQERYFSIDREREGEVSARGLSRSRSLPVSSSLFENLNLNSTSKASEVDKGNNNKGKSFFKGKVSSFFFNRSKKPEKVKVGTSPDMLDHTDPLSITSTRTTSGSNFKTKEECGTSIGALFKQTLSIDRSNSNDSLEKLLRPTRDQPSPTSVLDVAFDDTSGTEPDSSHPSIMSNQQPPLSRSSAIESVARTLSWDEKWLETPNKSPEFNRTISVANKEEQELYSFVEKLVSSSGFDTQRTYTILSRWHSLESPLDPTLVDKFLDPKEEAAKCRERRSNQRLLFDCVNMALLQIGHNILKTSYPWSNHHKILQDGLLITEVWRLVRELFSTEGKFVPEERENASLLVERVVKKEVDETKWPESMHIEVDEISREIGGFVLDDLVGEALDEFSISCS